MTSRVKILPSDVVLMIIDYLDSPSMTNCRGVCRDWLEIVEGNGFLWNYFLVPDDDRRCYTLNMLNLFSSKSNHCLKAFQLYNHIVRFRDTAGTSRSIVDTLLKSKHSLEIFSHRFSGRDILIRLYFLQNPLQFSNLKSFCGHNRMNSQLTTRIRIGRDAIDGADLKPSLVSIDSPYDSSSGRLLIDLVRASTLTLVHLNVDINLFSGRMELNFPNLQVLEIPYHRSYFDETLKVPKLKILTLSLDLEASLVTNFPSSIEEIWLIYPGWEGSLKRKGLDPLEEFYPRITTFRMDSKVSFYPNKVIKMVKARKAAVEKGLLVDGVAMVAINKLVIDFSKLDSPSLSKLQELVPEVGDARFAPTEVTINC